MARKRKDDGEKNVPVLAVGQRPRVNLKQLSEHLGLSRTTISLVLNDAPLAQRISADTKKRVLEAAEKLGYRPNYFARSLSGRRSRMIGVLAPDFGHGYDAMILGGMEHRLLSSEYMYFVSSHLWSTKVLNRSLEALIERGAEGLLLVNTTLPTEIRLPVVGIGSIASAAGAALISIDNAHGMRLAIEHLVELGHRKIALLKGHEHSSDTESRYESAISSAAALNVPIRPELCVQLERIGAEGMLSIDEGYVAASKLLRKKIPFTALLCFNDMSACGALHAIRDAGLRVPEDISVVGFDDIPTAKIVYPPLTTIRQPLREMGELAAETLLALIEQHVPAQSVCVQPELVVRRSTGTPEHVQGSRLRQWHHPPSFVVSKPTAVDSLPTLEA